MSLSSAGDWAVGVCSVVLLLVSPVASAAEWKLEPGLTVKQEYNDNLLLRSTQSPGAWSTTLSPRVAGSVSTETTSLTATLTTEIIRYAREGDLDLDTEDQFLDLAWDYKGERSTLTLAGSYYRDTTTRVDTAAPGDVPPPDQSIDLGLASRQFRRVIGRVRPSWTWRVSERSSLALDYRFLDVRYPSADPSDNLFDYRTHEPTVVLSYDLSERDHLSGRASYFVYRSPDANVTADSVQLVPRLSHGFSETISGEISLGPRYSWQHDDSVNGGADNQDLGVVVDARVEKKLARGSVGIGYFRGPASSASGALNQRDLVRVFGTTGLAPTIDLRIAAVAVRNDRLFSDSGGEDRRLYSLHPGFIWRFSPQWRADLSYEYKRQSSGSTSETATSNAAFIAISYQWPPVSISR
jgi:hypothetical protein